VAQPAADATPLPSQPGKRLMSDGRDDSLPGILPSGKWLPAMVTILPERRHLISLHLAVRNAKGTENYDLACGGAVEQTDGPAMPNRGAFTGFSSRMIF